MKYLGIVLLVLSGYVMAEEVYYCSDNTRGSNGFHKNKETGQYERSGFHEDKFKMKLQDDGNIAISDGGDTGLYLCSTPGNGHSTKMLNNKSCVHAYHIMGHINFNQDNGRYVRFYGFGYVFSNDDVIAHIGTCTKF